MGFDPQYMASSPDSGNYFGELRQKHVPERRCEAEFCHTKLSRENRNSRNGPYLCYVSRSKWVRSGSHVCEAIGCEIAIIYREDEPRRQASPFLCVEHDEQHVADPSSVPLKPKDAKPKYKRVRSERGVAGEDAENDNDEPIEADLSDFDQ